MRSVDYQIRNLFSLVKCIFVYSFLLAWAAHHNESELIFETNRQDETYYPNVLLNWNNSTVYFLICTYLGRLGRMVKCIRFKATDKKTTPPPNLINQSPLGILALSR